MTSPGKCVLLQSEPTSSKSSISGACAKTFVARASVARTDFIETSAVRSSGEHGARLDDAGATRPALNMPHGTESGQAIDFRVRDRLSKSRGEASKTSPRCCQRARRL